MTILVTRGAVLYISQGSVDGGNIADGMEEKLGERYAVQGTEPAVQFTGTEPAVQFTALQKTVRHEERHLGCEPTHNR